MTPAPGIGADIRKQEVTVATGLDWYALPGRRKAHVLVPIEVDDGPPEWGVVACSRWPSGQHPHWERTDENYAPPGLPRCKRCAREARP